MRSLAAAGLVGVSATSTYAGLVEPRAYELTETDILIRELPPAFDGFRIAQVSDLHHSPIVPHADIERVCALAQSVKADLIALTGDYTTARPSYVWPCAEALGTLNASAGVWAVLGNHDHYTDAELTTRALRRARIEVLDNAHTVITRGGDELQLVGVDDWSWGKSDWGRAFRGVDRRRPTVLLSHQPAVLDMPETESVSLILSGHTHGGQVSLPFIGAPVRFVNEFKYLRGHYQRGATQLYVSRGTGTVGLPVRLGARPEIAVLRLRRG
jgi:predicted MPP superfamily phosphohydrolase